MKKMYLVLLGILLVSSVFAIASFSNYQHAYDEYVSKKTSRDSELNKVNPTIDWTTDKECEIDSYGVSYCEGCYEYSYTFNKESYSGTRCIELEPFTTQQEDDDFADEDLEFFIKETLHPLEIITYVERDMTGVSIR